MKRILNLISCFFGFHEWTTPFLERKCEIDKEALERLGASEYSKVEFIVFCKHCKKVHSRLTQ